MMEIEDMNEIVRETHSERRIAIGNMGNKVDQITERYNAGICRGSGSLQEDLALCFILAVLTCKIFFV